MAGNLLLGGYLGSGNLGDDAVMLGFAHIAGLNGFDISILSGSPEETSRHYGMTAYARRDFKQIEAAIGQCDALVFPGGSIFQDVTSVRSVAYYQKVVSMAKKANKKVFLVGQGVGPLKSFLGKRMATSAFNDADGIAVRDPMSLEALRALGVKRPARVTADSAFLMPKRILDEDSASFSVGNMRTVGIAPRPLDKKHDVAGLFGDFCRLLFKSGTMPVLIEMDRNEDGELIAEISKRQGGKIPDLKKVPTPMQIQSRMARMDYVVAMRLHAGILAANVDIPPLMVSYDPKVTAFSKMLGLGPALSMDAGITAPRLLEAFLQFQKDRERNVKLLEKKREEMRKLAEGNFEVVRDGMRGAAVG
ncbi:MAG: polysaccharide pyruvyl transferase CsaB [Fimbriimonas sp.]